LARLYQQGQDAGDSGVSFDLEDQGQGAQQRDLLEDTEDAPVIQLVNTLLRRAVTAGASDLHVEPHEDGLRTRMRVDGFLQTAMDRSDVPVRKIISRLKVMAGLDIAETRLPQDGRIPLRMGGRLIDTRVSSLPGKYGERIVLRILDRSTGRARPPRCIRCCNWPTVKNAISSPSKTRWNMICPASAKARSTPRSA